MSNVKTLKETIKKIDPKREYNLSHIQQEEIFPWARNISTVRKIVKVDYWGENMLKAHISGTGRALEYKITGKNIISFLEKYGPGFLFNLKKPR